MRRLKENIGRFLLRRKLKHFNREKQIQNFSTTKTAGIVFTLNGNESHLQHVVEFIEFLYKHNIEVNYIAFTNSKKLPSYFNSVEGLKLYTRKNLTWHQHIKDQETITFAEQEFDMLIDLSEKNCFPIEYIISTSKAKFKVGRFVNKPQLYDFMIDLTNNTDDTSFYIEQLKHYLNLINN